MSQQTFIDRAKKMIADLGLELVEYKDNKNIIINCSCGTKNYKTTSTNLKDRKRCRNCNNKLNENDIEKIILEISQDDEKWAKYENKYFSSNARILNESGNLIKPIEEKDNNKALRVFISNKIGRPYLGRCIAIAFKIEGYEKILNENQEYVVSYIDKNNRNCSLSNLVILSKSQAIERSRCGERSKQSEDFKEKSKLKKEDFDHLEKRQLYFLPNHTFYSNGFIYNNIENRFLTGTSHSDGYKQVCFSNSTTYNWHRLVCMAFHPIEGKTKLEDYDDLQVNHIDNDRKNNNPDNLEWVSQSENQIHSEKTKNNKRGTPVSQYEYDYETKTVGKKIATFNSQADAERETGIKVHKISEVAKGKRKVQKGEYMWMYEHPEEIEEKRQNYTKHLIKK